MGALLDKAGSGEVLSLMILGLIVIAATVIAVTALFGSNWRKVRVAQLDADLKREMVGRGMSASDIVQVICARRDRPDDQGEEIPSPSEVIIDQDGTWYPGIALRRKGSLWYVHYVGYDTDSNEWVGPERLRFPLSYFEGEQVEPQHTAPNGVHTAQAPGKQASADPEF